MISPSGGASSRPLPSPTPPTPPAEAIAVVGLACRLPQAQNPGAFWELLWGGRSAITQAPADRPGLGAGGYLDAIDRFDAAFFGISPREAAALDPQQRLVLELGWEALEDAGIVPGHLREASHDGTASVGVFVGAVADDYATLHHRRGTAAVTHHTLTGLHRGMVANRLSYALGLNGPSMTVDSGQSSSLVAVHQACQSLRSGESTLALAGGVHLNLAEENALGVQAFGALSPDGRCYTFDARANGYVRGEGGGLVVLKPLAAALADGDTVHGVIRGSAVNNDGGGDGLTVPRRQAQEACILRAHRQAGVEPGDVAYVELHGTGTRLGDPIEAAALGAALGTRRPTGAALAVGSVKTNIGHLEGAAGIAGLLKVLLALRHRELPPSLNFSTPNPAIPLQALNLRVVTERTALDDTPHHADGAATPPLAGVSSFGMGGTNCHVVVAGWHTAPDGATPARPASPAATPLLLSGATEPALREQAARLGHHLATHPELGIADVAHTLATARTHHPHRAALVTTGGGHDDDRDELLRAVEALATGRSTAGLVTGTPDPAGPGGLTLLLTGQGSQRPGMGLALREAFPAFRAAFDEACAAVDRWLDLPVQHVIAERPELLDQTRYAQPALFALETGLFRLVTSWGLLPDALLGHSVGEIAAAHAADVLTLDDAAALVTARGRLMQAMRGDGAMAALQTSEDEIQPHLAAHAGRVDLAAVNGPHAVVVSGDADAVAELADHWARQGRKTKRLRTSHAFHSHHLDDMLAAFGDVAAGLSFHSPRLTVISNVTGRPADADEIRTPEYWVRQARLPVRFAEGVAHAHAERGTGSFLELGPAAVLSPMGRECLPADARAVCVPLLRHDRPEPQTAVTAVARLHTRGHHVDWGAFPFVAQAEGRESEGEGGEVAAARRVPLPTYAFQRERHWLAEVPAFRTADGERDGSVPAPEPADTAPAPSPSPDDDGDHRRGERVRGDERDTLRRVVEETASVLGFPSSDAVRTGVTFRDLGFDSFMAVELRDRLRDTTELPLPSTILFDHPTPAALAAYLAHGPEDTAGGDASPAVAGARLDEPVAIVGMACRYPGGVSSPEELWRLVVEGGDAISAFPTDRGWDVGSLFDPDPDAERPGTSYVREGGFLDGAGDFDAGLFGISPREALGMDPQQRLLLETSWEAFERAGIDPLSVRGSRTGVFAGVTAQDYGPRLHEADDTLGGHRLTGTTPSVASGRVAYSFGLEGPAVTVDTACSSSLVALHLAVQALRQGECDLALAGGATVMASPGMFTEFSRQRGLAADGRCKPFAEAADGTAWAEGVGLLLVERLSDARRNGHRVLAVVRGSAINQDGASNGLTAPSGLAQQRVIRAALASANLTSSDVDAVEAHGTGTTLGDPIEAQALLATYGQGRVEGRPLWLGSLKSNIGHAQAAAGVGGVIKMVEAMRRGVLPRTLHVDEPSSHVDWTAGDVRLLTEEQRWPEVERPRRAAVSSFGVSGTNAHVVIEEGERSAPVEGGSEAPGGVVPLVVSAADEGGLDALVEWVVGVGEGLVDVGWSLATGRAELTHRAVVVGGDVVRGRVAVGGDRPVFVFPGQGSQWVGMGRELLGVSPVFAEWIGACEEALSAFVEWSLVEVLESEEEGWLGRVDVVQPVLWAVMVSLAGLWRSAGVEPAAVVGHSQGEIAAAVVAGGLSLSDGARVVALRSQAIRAALAGRGGMVSVNEPVDAVETRIGGWPGRLSVAAVNGPRATVVSGEPAALDELVAACEYDGVRARRIPVDYASHSSQVEELRDRILSDLSSVAPVSGRVPFYSTLTGGPLDTSELGAGYWFENLRRPVRFDRALEAVVGDGSGVVIEVSAHPVLAVGIEDAVAVGTLRRGEGGWERFLASLGEAWVNGVPVEWAKVLPTGRQVDIPTYPFQRQRFWLVGDVSTSSPDALGLGETGHPLVGAGVELVDSGGHLFTGSVSSRSVPWVVDHAVGGVVLVPGTALLELAVHAGDRVGCGRVEELTLEAPLVVPEVGEVRLQVVVGAPDDDGRRALTVHSRQADQDWLRNATGTLAVHPSPETPAPASWPPVPNAEELGVAALYEHLADGGFGYGPAFRGLRRVWRHGDDWFAEVVLPDEAAPAPGPESEDTGFALHPALLDAALHALGEDILVGERLTCLLPFAWQNVTLHASGATALRVHLRRRHGQGVSLAAFDAATGTPVVSAESLRFRPVSAGQLREPDSRDGGLFRVVWTPFVPDEANEADEQREGTPPDASVDVVEFSGSGAALPAGDDLPAALHSLATRALATVQEWLADPAHDERRLVAVTRGAVAAGGGDDVTDLPAAAVWGLLRTAQTENPGRLALIDVDGDPHGDPVGDLDLDLDPRGAGASRAALLSAVAASATEPQLAVRSGTVLVPRVEVVPTPAETTGEDPPFAAGGTVLITGGSGTLARRVARHLVDEHGVRDLLLASRRGPEAPGAEEFAAELGASGARVHQVACDVSDRAQLARLVEGRRLAAVVHTAGTLDDGVLGSLTPERLAGVLRPKADAAWHLHELTRDHGLSAFVLFSSVIGTLGGAGQANYAAANAFLDALAHHRRAQGLPAVSLAWGLWAESSGMTGGMSEADRLRMSRGGVAPLDTERGLALFDAGCGSGEAVAVAAALDVDALVHSAAAAEIPPLLRGLARRASLGGGAGGPSSVARRRLTASPADDRGELARRLAPLSMDGRRELLVEFVRSHAANALGHASDAAVDARRSFRDIGFDSLLGLELRNRLNAASGLRLPATAVFDYPTPEALAGFLLSQLVPDGDGAANPPERAAAVPGAAGQSQAVADDPVVIVGMACRYPGGVSSPDELWRLVVDGVDAVSPFPTDRGWDLASLYDPDPERVGTSYTREGGFLHGAAEFDAEFFGISPREALAMDPQQRLLLEASWEAVEHAGIDPHSLRGEAVGVFAGLMYHDYAARLSTAPEGFEGHLLTGSTGSVVSGRIAYTLGLEGPAVTVDTACSSSLVALHLAVQAVRQGECSMALAGGVTVMATPHTFVEFSRQRGLAADGRCKPFAEAADGTGWGEGVGVLVVERLSDARRNGHRVLAVVRGSATNQDGASNGLTAPNGPSQQRVIRQALASAGLSTADVDAVEAHGTGTTLGDPIEAQALLATYGQGRPEDRPLWLGSVKSNIGHTQAASGVAGVIKMVQAMRHGVVPGTLHVDAPSSHVDWSAGEVRLATEAVAWPEVEGRPRRAGVSSFGISGTNAHVVLEQPTPDLVPEAEAGSEPSPSLPWLLTARSDNALRAQAARLRDHLGAHPELRPADVAHALATTRSTFEHRAVLLAGPAGLDALADHDAATDTDATVVRGTALPGPRVVFVFPGQGSQWAGMALDLAERSPVFAARLRACADALAPYVDWSLTEVLAEPGAPLLERVDVVQPALFAVMLSLAELWRAHGVEPSAVVGHSQGEIAAACVAGALSLQDAARIVALRSQALRALSGRGGMVSVAAPEAEVREWLAAHWDGRLAVATVNGPGAVVVSGDPDSLTELLAACEAREVRARRIPVDYASHSPQVEAIRDEILAALDGVRPGRATVPFHSTVTGEILEGPELDAGYWYRNLRQTVRFGEAVERLLAGADTIFVEVSPHPVLTAGTAESADRVEGRQAAIVDTLRRGEGGLERFRLALATAYVNGAPVVWTPTATAGTTATGTGHGSRSGSGDEAAAGRPVPVPLPTYPFQRQRYWLEPATPPRDRSELDSWRYRVGWIPTPARPARAEGQSLLTGHWLVVLPQEQVADEPALAVTRALTEHGAHAVPVTAPVDADREDLAARLRAAIGTLPEGTHPAGVLSLLGLHEAHLPAHPAVPGGLAATVALVQALGDVGDAAVGAPLWLATRGAVSVDRSERPGSTTQSLIWGLGRVVALEHADRWGGLLDLPVTPLDEAARLRLASALAGVRGADAKPADAPEDQLALRPSGVFVRRLARATTPARSTPRWQPRGTVLITGGTGALGAHVARWLARNGAAHLLLTSRRGPEAPGAATLRAELGQLGVEVTIAACDVADREAVASLLDEIPDEHPLTAVVHTAAVLDDAVVDTLRPEQMNRALPPKVTAALTLHELTRHLDLDAFVLFSSIAGTLGVPGQGNYAPGNAFLDALAETRHADGLVATSVAWGAWADGGMAAQEDVADLLRRHGLPEMAPERALAALQQAVDAGEPCVSVVEIDWERFFLAFTASRTRPLLHDIPEVRQIRAATARRESAEPGGGALRDRLAEATAPERDRILLDLVRAHVAAVLGHAGAEAVEAGRAFKALGFDSLTGVEIRNRLNGATGLRLPATAVYDYPTPAALAGYIRARLLPELAEPAGHGDHAEPARLAGHADLAERTGGEDDPVVIVAMSCRFPGGARSPQELWDLVAAGTDTMTAFPLDRGWRLEGFFDPDPDTPGTSYVREGAFLDAAADFDADFFGISPREALAMDPQQRLMLELSWELFERAGIDPTTLRGSATGVYAGTNGQDYPALLASAASAPDGVSDAPSGTLSDAHAAPGSEGYRSTGAAASVLSGRISYAFGLEGPALTVDTACSSALVALHLAAQALRQGECDLALAGAVTVMSTPDIFVEFSRQRGLAADGRCKPFAAAADGTGWGEGAGLLLLERLSDARRNGHDVLAVVRGSAVNQDGASNGLTAPNGPSQQRCITAALANAGLSPRDVDAVEAHGTGTTLGDPIEAQALIATYGQGRGDDDPLWLGSVKSNIGHTQAAAGVAGIIKMIMAMRHETLPRSLHLDAPTPHVDWDEGAVRPLSEARPWQPRVAGQPRRFGVSAFGISGTNAHVVIEQAALTDDGGGSDVSGGDTEDRGESSGGVAPATRQPSPGVHLLPLSGRNETALRAQAQRLGAFLDEHPELPLADVAYSLATARAALPARAVIDAGDRTALRTALDALAHGHPAPTLVQGRTAAGDGSVAFLFTGQGSQRLGMGAELSSVFPVFGAAFDEVCAVVDGRLGRSLGGVLAGEAEVLERTEFAQPALFALEVALFRLLESWGLTPDLLAGHSVGEVAAAHVAGVLSLGDAVALVVARGRLMQGQRGDGAMVAVEASVDEVAPLVAERGGRVALAAVNGPRAVVVSGDVDAVEEVAEFWRVRGRRTRRLRTSHAFHSPHMDGMLADFATVAEGVSFRAPHIPIVSNLTGTLVSEDDIRAPEYWVRHARQAVRFADGIAHLHERGVRTFLELGPDAVLSAMARECLADAEAGPAAETSTAAGTAADAGAVAVPTLRGGRDEATTLVSAVARLAVRGHVTDRPALHGRRATPTVPLPTYPFQRQRFWLAPGSPSPAGHPGVSGTADPHPLLPDAVVLADGDGLLLTGRLSPEAQPWLADHVILGSLIVPGTAFVEMAWQAGSHVGCDRIEELTLEAPLPLPPEGAQVQLRVGEADASGRRTLTLHSREAAGDAGTPWTRHATGVLTPSPSPSPRETPAADACPPPGAEAIPAADFYERFAARGFDLGPAFQGLRAAWRVGDTVLAEVALPDEQREEATRYGVHPALLDAALHAGGLDTLDESTGRLPFAWHDVTCHGTGASALRVELAAAGEDPDGGASVTMRDDSGALVARIGRLVTRRLSPEQLATATRREGLYRVEWRPLDPADAAGSDVGTGAGSGEGAGVGRWARLGQPADPLDGLADLPGYGDAADLAKAIVDGAPAPDVVFVSLTAKAARPHPDAHEPVHQPVHQSVAEEAHDLARRALELVQSWLAVELPDTRLAVLTRGAVSTGRSNGNGNGDGAGEGDGDGLLDLAAAPVWGLVAAAQAEHPGRFVLIDAEQAPADPTLLAQALASGEPRAALRAGRVHAPRLAPAPAPVPAPDARAQEPVWRTDGTVLVTGATGALGHLVARHLVTEHGVRRLLLLSRSGPEAEGATELTAELSAHGATVELRACDVADRSQLGDALAAADTPEHPLTAVVHLAGLLDDGVVEALTPGRLDAVLRPKADAAWHLHELTRHHDLSAFVLFSSVAGLLGGAGQANYAAANAFLDALAQHRTAAGLPAQSLVWGAWADGMAGRLAEAHRDRLGRFGVRALTAEAGLSLLDAACRAPHEPVLVPFGLDLASLRAAHATTSSPLPPLLRGLVPERRTPRRVAQALARPGSRAGAGGGAGAGVGAGVAAERLRERLAGRSVPDATEVLLELVRAKAALALGHAGPEAVDPGRGFTEAGFDSLAAVDLRNHLNEVTGLHLASTSLFDHPTPLALARHMAERLAAEARARAEAEARAGAGTGSAAALSATTTTPTASPAEQLDALEEALWSRPVEEVDDAERGAVVARLERLLSRWRPTAAAATDEAIQNASDDELFGLIEKDLGLS
ncbi:SDR family NAD(P)-dependent oxidoreductase [Streptomyces sp. 4N509B]|uniref:SDR family NAD(P)-dependent oxidoreductase n=1 Tax=Streptomyces sp. 4N509B TaxID=3457413 RepID=UPI003FCEEB84